MKEKTFRRKCKDKEAMLCGLLSSMVYSVVDHRKGRNSAERWKAAVDHQLLKGHGGHDVELRRLVLVHSSQDAVFLHDPETRTCYTVARGTCIGENHCNAGKRDGWNDVRYHMRGEWSNRAMTLAKEHQKAFGGRSYASCRHVATGHSAGGSDAEYLADSKLVNVSHSFNAGGLMYPAASTPLGHREGERHAHKIPGDVLSWWRPLTSDRPRRQCNYQRHTYAANYGCGKHDAANFAELSLWERIDDDPQTPRGTTKAPGKAPEGPQAPGGRASGGTARSPGSAQAPGGTARSPGSTQAPGGTAGAKTPGGTETPGGISLQADPRTMGVGFCGSVAVFSQALEDFPPEVMAEVFHLVFSTGRDPVFSLDPADPTNPDGPWQVRMCLPAEARDTCVEYIMWRADWVLKQLSMGIQHNDVAGSQADLDPQWLACKGLGDFRSSFDLSWQKAGSTQTSEYHRLWISCDQVELHTGTDGRSLRVGRAAMRVDARRMVRGADGSLGDAPVQDLTDADAQFAAYLTQHYDKLAAVFPELASLRSLQALFALAKYARDELRIPHAMLNREWIEGARAEVQAEYGRSCVPRLRKERAEKTILEGERRLEAVEQVGTQRTERWVTPCITRSLVVIGGVNMSCKTLLLPQSTVDKMFNAAKTIHSALTTPTEVPEQQMQELMDYVPYPLFLPRCSHTGCQCDVLLPENPKLWRSNTASTHEGRPWCPEHHPLRCELRSCCAASSVTDDGDLELKAVTRDGRRLHACCARRLEQLTLQLSEAWPRGTRVMLHSLGSADLNGRFGSVEGVDMDRLKVRLGEGSLPKAVDPAKVLGARAYTTGMEEPVMNGQLGDVRGVCGGSIRVDFGVLGESLLPAGHLVCVSDFWTSGQKVLAHDGPQQGSFCTVVAACQDQVFVSTPGQPRCVIAPQQLLGLTVVLHSLKAVELNGRVGAISGWDAGSRRVMVGVVLADGQREKKSIRPANLRTLKG